MSFLFESSKDCKLRQIKIKNQYVRSNINIYTHGELVPEGSNAD
jgi:hypothetical protein